MSDPTQGNRIIFVSQFAAAGVSDPDIADRLGITPSAVAYLRRRNGIPAGERRWLPVSEPGAAANRSHLESCHGSPPPAVEP